MALSTTFTQCAPETTKFGKKTQGRLIAGGSKAKELTN